MMLPGLKKYLIPVVILLALAGAFLLLQSSVYQDFVGTKKTYQIGIVSYGGTHREAIDGLKAGMEALGYSEGRTVIYHEVDAAGSESKVRDAAKDFLGKGVDAVYTISTPVTKQVIEVVKDKPVVFNVVSDPVGAGFAKKLDAPGGNSTGCSNYVAQTGPKRLEILKSLLPNARKILVLYDPKNQFSSDAIISLRDAASILKLDLAEVHIKSKEEVIKTMGSLREGEYDAFFHLGEAKVTSAADDVIRVANAIKLPTVAHEESFVKKGMLAIFGPSWFVLGRQCAGTMDKVLQGASPAEIPIQIPANFDFILNLRTAKNLGLEIPKEVLSTVNKFVE